MVRLGWYGILMLAEALRNMLSSKQWNNNTSYIKLVYFWYTNYKTNYLHQCIVLKYFYTLKPSTHIKINFKITPTYLVYLYSTIKMTHGPKHLRLASTCWKIPRFHTQRKESTLMQQHNRDFNKCGLCGSGYAQTKWRPLQIRPDPCKCISRILISCSQKRPSHESRDRCTVCNISQF